jgi:hypothetical protein
VVLGLAGVAFWFPRRSIGQANKSATEKVTSVLTTNPKKTVDSQTFRVQSFGRHELESEARSSEFVTSHSGGDGQIWYEMAAER